METIHGRNIVEYRSVEITFEDLYLRPHLPIDRLNMFEGNKVAAAINACR
jgi:hypothetical protein